MELMMDIDIHELLAQNVDGEESTVSSGTTHTIFENHGSMMPIATGKNWGGSFHSQGADDNDYLDDNNLYIDLGDDSDAELDIAFTAVVIKVKIKACVRKGHRSLRHFCRNMARFR